MASTTREMAMSTPKTTARIVGTFEGLGAADAEAAAEPGVLLELG